MPAATMSIARLRARDVRDGALRRQSDQRQSLDRVHGHAWSDELEQSRDEVDLDRKLAELAQQGEQLVHRLVGERDDHPLHVEAASRSPARRSGPPRMARCSGRSAAATFGSRSMNPTTLTPYSGCLTSLRPISWPISPAPTITVFCCVGSRPLAGTARDGAGDRQDADREGPERDEREDARVRPPTDP